MDTMDIYNNQDLKELDDEEEDGEEYSEELKTLHDQLPETMAMLGPTDRRQNGDGEEHMVDGAYTMWIVDWSQISQY